jgi:hypothetical protein
MQNFLLLAASARTPPDLEVPLWMPSELFSAHWIKIHEINCMSIKKKGVEAFCNSGLIKILTEMSLLPFSILINFIK